MVDRVRAWEGEHFSVGKEVAGSRRQAPRHVKEKVIRSPAEMKSAVIAALLIASAAAVHVDLLTCVASSSAFPLACLSRDRVESDPRAPRLLPPSHLSPRFDGAKGTTSESFSLTNDPVSRGPTS